jgi:hypothetical protein
MSRRPRVLTLGLSMALGACAVPPLAGGDRPDGAPRYQLQQVDPLQLSASTPGTGASRIQEE